MPDHPENSVQEVAPDAKRTKSWPNGRPGKRSRRRRGTETAMNQSYRHQKGGRTTHVGQHRHWKLIAAADFFTTRGADQAWTATIHSAVLHRALDAQSAYRRNRIECERIVD